MKAALCISGTIQNFERCVFNLHKIVQQYNCDVFIAITSDVNEADLHRIKCLYQPKNITIQKPHYPKGLNAEYKGMYHHFDGIRHCNDLKKNFELENKFKYNLVIHTKFNVNIIDQISPEEASNMDAIYVPLFNVDYGLNPYIAFGNSDLMNIYSDTFSRVAEYASHNLSLSLEKMLLWALNQRNARIRLSHINHSILEGDTEVNLMEQYRGRRKRVAICMSGLMRMGLENFDNFKKTFLLPHYDYDVFIDTWNSVQTARNIRVLTLHEFIKRIKLNYKPRIFHSENVLNFQYSRLVLERNRECRSIQNLLSMCYKIRACNELKKQYEIRNNFLYDSVVRIRSDMESTSPINVIENLHLLNIPDQADYSGINDQFAFSNSKNMDLYSSWFDKIDYYLSLHHKVSFNMEVLTKINILKNRIPLNRFVCEYNLLRPDWGRQNNRAHAKAIGCSDMQPSQSWTELTGLGFNI